MQIDFTSIPQTLDAFHLILTLVVAILVTVVVMRAKPQTIDSEPAPAPQVEEPQAKAQPIELLDANPTSALQLLSLLQQESRFIDFVQEDLSSFGDADIGAAARVVHTGAKKVLENYFELSPVSDQAEESRITLEAGFNAGETRLTGNVVGEAPFTGTLVHKGWKATQTHLPKLSAEHDAQILAPAEVEL